MTSKPILFSAQMVRALLEGRKTMTRRIVKPQPSSGFLARGVVGIEPQWPLQDGVRWFMRDGMSELVKCPYGEPGTRLWVKEEHYRFGHWEPVPGVKTKSGRMKWRFIEDSPELRFDAPDSFRKGRHHKDPETPAWHKRLARFMFRKHSRITLEVTAVRVERLQDISDADAKAEGVTVRFDAHVAAAVAGPPETPARMEFWDLWRSINGPDSWGANPFVWVIEFKRVEESSL